MRYGEESALGYGKEVRERDLEEHRGGKTSHPLRGTRRPQQRCVSGGQKARIRPLTLSGANAGMMKGW